MNYEIFEMLSLGMISTCLLLAIVAVVVGAVMLFKDEWGRK